MSIHIKEPNETAQGCMIWMHGLGADASDMMGLASELKGSVPLRHVFLDAPVRPVTLNNRMPMRAWYDIYGMTLADREDRDGIMTSEQTIREVIEQQIAAGFPSTSIVLAGFSQGAAMAMYTALKYPQPLGGMISLSGYLLLAKDNYCEQHRQIPIFLGMGEQDSVVLPQWTALSLTRLRQDGYDHITSHSYPIGHGICLDEIRDLSLWITQVFQRSHDQKETT